MDCARWVIELDTKDISFIVGIFEGYDDFGIVRTLDAGRGHIELLLSPDYVEEVGKLLESLSEEIPLRVLQKS
ncbi:MAG: DUF4911 domain-containing protein [Nitrospinales bacterium]